MLPKKTVVDYDKMRKLEKLHESLKSMLVADDAAVEAKKAELTESFNKDRKAFETQIAKLQVKLNESVKKSMDLNKKLDHLKAVELLESKTKDLPAFEARQLKKRFANASAAEVESKFKLVYESIKEELKNEDDDQEASIEEEVKDIIEAEENVKEDDLLKNRPHNNHIAEDEDEEVDEDDILKNRPHNNHIAEGDEEDADKVEDDLDEEDVDEINESAMAAWVKRASMIY